MRSNRRAFLKSGVAFTGLIWVPRLPAASRRDLLLSKKPEGPTVFSPAWVTYDSGDRLARGSGLNAQADSKKLLFSAWFNRATTFGTFMAFGPYATNYLRTYFQADNSFTIDAYNSGPTLIASFNSTTQFSSSGWHHIAYSVDLDIADSDFMYVDDVQETPAGRTFNGGAGDINYDSAPDWGIGDIPSGGVGFIGCMGEFYCHFGAYLNLSTEANRRKFISAGGDPVDLGSNGSLPTGSQPIIYLKGDASSFNINSGSGGNFTQTGTLTSCTGP